MDLIDEIDRLLTEKEENSSEVKRLIAIGANSVAFKDLLMSRRAIVALNERDIPQALSAAWYAVQRNATKPEYAMLLGKVYLACREIDLALEAFESAVALQPDNFDYQFIYLQTLYLRRPALAQTITREIAKYVTARSLDRYTAFAKHLKVSVEGGAWCEDGVVTIWTPKDGLRSYAKFRVSWMDRGGWASEIVELSDVSDRSVSTVSFPWRPGAELCTIKKARNGELLHGCPLFGKQADKSMPATRELGHPDTRAVQVIIPVYKGLKETRNCLDSVMGANTDVPFRVTMVLDNPADPKLKQYVKSLQGDPRVTLLENVENVGFTASVNQALDTNAGEDVVLLNADTVVPNGWLDRLKRAAFSAPDIGTVTPLTNNGEIVSFPIARERNKIPPGLSLAEIDHAAAEVNHGVCVDLPTGVGFCLFIKAETLQAVGRLDSFNFGRGYGEETDFCLRARAIGWRSICATDVFVEHVSQVSFGVEKDALARLNMKRVQKKHPEYSALMQGFLAENPLAEPMRLLERAILSKRKSKAWSLVFAPRDWRTNIGLEAFRHDAAVNNMPVLWCYPDSQITDQIWLTSDTTFDFGRLSYDLPADGPNLLQDIKSLEITDIHWFEMPRSEIIVDALTATNVPQVSYIYSADMVGYFSSCDRASSKSLTSGNVTVQVCTAFGQQIAQAAGFTNIKHVGLQSTKFELPAASDVPKEQNKDSVRIAVVDGFQSTEGVASFIDLARYVAAKDIPITFYLFANTLHDVALSRTSRVVPLGFVEPDRHEMMLKHLRCDAALSIDLDPDPAPLSLMRISPFVSHIFCFDGAGRNDLAQALANAVLLRRDMPSADIVQAMLHRFETTVELDVCEN